MDLLHADATVAGGLAIYTFEGADVRICDRDGNPWFVAADVCRVLDIGNPSQAASRLDDDERDDLCLTDTIGRQQRYAIVSESGLYTLILRSRQAVTPGTVQHRFRKWVTAEVIPSIRKTGGYGQPDPMALLNDPAALRGLLAGYSEKVMVLQEQNAAMRPKVDALDRIATANGSLCITDAAKVVQVSPKVLFDYLRAHDWIYRRAGTAEDVAKQHRINSGLMEHKITTVIHPDGTEKIRTQARVTPKGMSVLAAAMKAVKG
jgi:prophage antirepressor-like protein